MQAPLPWDLSKCVSLARVLQRMAHLFKQQPLQNSLMQHVSIIAQFVAFRKIDAERNFKGIKWSVTEQSYVQVLFWHTTFS